MSFTFSDNQEVDYLSLGMCDICAVRFSTGCEHSNREEYQKWAAAYFAVEQSAEHVDYFISRFEAEQEHPANTAYALETGSIRTDSEIPFSDGFCDERLDTGLTEGEQIKDYFGNVKVTASDEWRKRHLNH